MPNRIEPPGNSASFFNVSPVLMFSGKDCWKESQQSGKCNTLPLPPEHDQAKPWLTSLFVLLGRKSLQTELVLKLMGEWCLVLNHSESDHWKNPLPYFWLFMGSWCIAPERPHTSCLQRVPACFTFLVLGGFLMLWARQVRASCVQWGEPRSGRPKTQALP